MCTLYAQKHSQGCIQGESGGWRNRRTYMCLISLHILYHSMFHFIHSNKPAGFLPPPISPGTNTHISDGTHSLYTLANYNFKLSIRQIKTRDIKCNLSGYRDDDISYKRCSLLLHSKNRKCIWRKCAFEFETNTDLSYLLPLTLKVIEKFRQEDVTLTRSNTFHLGMHISNS